MTNATSRINQRFGRSWRTLAGLALVAMAGCSEDLAPDHRAAYEAYVKSTCECAKVLDEIPTEVDAAGVESVDTEQAKEFARKADKCHADAYRRFDEERRRHTYSQGLTEEAHAQLEAFDEAVGRCRADVIRLR